MQGAEVLACGSNINAEGKLRIGTRNSEWYPTGLGGIGSVVGDEVADPLRWSEHLCNGSPAQIEACGDHHTLVLMQGGEVFAIGRGGHGEHWVYIYVAARFLSGGRSTCATVRQRG